MSTTSRSWIIGLMAASLACLAPAANPTRPVITEVYTDPVGADDGPVGRDPTSQHQEYVEIYLPTAANLAAGLNKDALRLAFYEVEGDSDSSGLGLVNYRFDLPTFDLDATNGITAGALPRPASGMVVLGWLDYVGNPPTALAAAPSTRVALIHGGVTSTPGYTFVAINGAQFGGTTNFAVVAAESRIDMPAEASSGIVQNGSAAYLLVNRDSASYVALYDDQNVPVGGGANPNLPAGTPLGTTCLLDGFASNDHGKFAVDEQPYAAPTDDDIDLETVLPAGGAFSNRVCQMPENDATRPDVGQAAGYARLYPDVARTTDNAVAGDDDPIADALEAYRQIRNTGPFFPSPGSVALSTSAAELSVASASEQSFSVLAGTTGRPGIFCANVGGQRPIHMTPAVGASSNPPAATFAPGDAAASINGFQYGSPSIAISVSASAAAGASATATATVTAANAVGGAPAVVNAVRSVTVTATVLRPTTGQTAGGAPLQATVFAAVQPIVSSTALNEFAATSLGQYVAANLGGAVQDTRGNGPTLVSPGFNWGDGAASQPLVKEFPDVELDYLNPAGAPGGLSLGQTVAASAEIASGAATYELSFDATGTALRSVRLNFPDIQTFGGTFSPAERLFFADARGSVGDVRSGLSNATTTRGFELALVESNVRLDGSIESGATDDSGLVVEVSDVEAGSPIAPGEFVFLSLTGGLQGADLDSLQVLPGTDVVGNVIYLDLDKLHDVLGVRSLESIYLIDAGDAGPEADFIDAFALKLAGAPGACPGDRDGDGDTDLDDLLMVLGAFGQPGPGSPGDADGDGDTDLDDLLVVLGAFQQACP